MTDSELRFKVTGDASSGASALARMVAPLTRLKQEATQTKTALAGLKGTKATVDVEDQAIERARKEIARLRDEIATDLQADINADTRPAQRRINQLESSIRQLGKRAKISPDVDTSKLSRLKAGLDKVKSGLSSVGSGLASFGAGVGRIAGNVGVPVIGALGATAAAAATGVGLLAVKSLGLADNLDNAKIAFSQFLGSAGKADAFLNDLRGLAAKTPFEFPELVDSSKRLLAFGVAGKDVVPIMTALGDAAALTGNSVDDLATIYGQMFAKGKVQNEELLQLTERGVPALQILADKLKLSKAEVQDLASKGKLGADAIRALQTGIEEKFGGGMAKQAKTLGGMISTLKDTLSGILTDVGTAVLPIAKSVFPSIIKGAESLGDRVKGLMPTVVDAIAGGLQGLLSLPGTLLRGMAGVVQGISGMVAGVQASVSQLVGGIATALESLPAIFGDIDTSGLRDAQLGLAQAAIETNRVGKSSFDGLNEAAANADRTLGPLKSKLEQARQTAQSGMALQLKTDEFDTKIAAVDSKIKTLKQQKANATLDADKKYFDQKIAAAQAEKKKLQQGKATAVVDAKIDGLKTKVVSAKAQLNDLKKQKPTPEIRAKINELEAKVRSGKAKLADLNKQRPTPRADLNSAALNAAARSATSKVSALDKKKATPNVGLKWAGGMTPAQAQRQINGIKGKTVTVTVEQKRKGSRPTGGGVPSDAGFRAGFAATPLAGVTGKLASVAHGLQGLAAATATRRAGYTGDSLSAALSAAGLNVAGGNINISTPAPQVTVVTRDSALAEFIGVIVDGKAVRATRVQQRKQPVQL